MSDYLKKLESEDFFETLNADFVVEEIAPRVGKALVDFGDGWYDDGEIHSREIDAMLAYIEGRIKP